MATLNATNLKHASSGSNNIVLASDGSTTISNLSGGVGKILQVVSTPVDAYSSMALSTQYSFYEITPLTTNITTTAANSKILVSAGICGEGNHEDYNIGIRCGRVIGGSLSILFLGATAGSRLSVLGMHNGSYFSNDQNSTTAYNSFSNMLDLPNQSAGTTITYKFFLATLAGANCTYYLNGTVGNSDTQSHERTFSHLTLQEVSA